MKIHDSSRHRIRLTLTLNLNRHQSFRGQQMCKAFGIYIYGFYLCLVSSEFISLFVANNQIEQFFLYFQNIQQNSYIFALSIFRFCFCVALIQTKHIQLWIFMRSRVER